MKNRKAGLTLDCHVGIGRGFTLIELLVVVLIIGILAAVALPQYQKAVDKSKYATMISYVKALENAQDVYYLENGQYADDWNLLNIDFPQGTEVDKYNRPILNHIKFETGANNSAAYYLTPENKIIASYVIYHKHHTDSTIDATFFKGAASQGKIACFSYGNYLERGGKICEAMGGTLIKENASCGSTCNVYEL